MTDKDRVREYFTVMLANIMAEAIDANMDNDEIVEVLRSAERSLNILTSATPAEPRPI